VNHENLPQQIQLCTCSLRSQNQALCIFPQACIQGLKKCKFPGKLVEISRGPQVEDDRPFMTSQ